jgi:hypothetical protein
MQGKWVVKIGWQLCRIDITGNICLRRLRPTQGCTADDDDDNNDMIIIIIIIILIMVFS